MTAEDTHLMFELKQFFEAHGESIPDELRRNDAAKAPDDAIANQRGVTLV